MLATIILIALAMLLCGGVVGWALRDAKERRLESRVIDLRDRIEPYGPDRQRVSAG